eukprot:9821620-Alexandrium_andersonii.AAC.2
MECPCLWLCNAQALPEQGGHRSYLRSSAHSGLRAGQGQGSGPQCLQTVAQDHLKRSNSTSCKSALEFKTLPWVCRWPSIEAKARTRLAVTS